MRLTILFCFLQKQASEIEQLDHKISEKPSLVVESLKEEAGAGWPSLGRLLFDLFKFAIEAMGSMFLNLMPQSLIPGRAKQGLSPLKDNLVMPEDRAEPPPLAQKQVSPSPMSETHHTSNLSNDTPLRPQKSNKPPKYKDPSLSGKHRSSKRQDYAEFYGSGESPQLSSKGPKERVRHRHRDKSGEVYGAVGTEPKPVDMKSAEYSNSKFDQYTFRSKYGADNTYQY